MTIIEYNNHIDEIKFKLWRDALAKVSETDINAGDREMTNEQRFYEAAMLISEKLAKLQYVNESSKKYFKFEAGK